MVNKEIGRILGSADGGFPQVKAEALAQGKVNRTDLDRTLEGRLQGGLEFAPVVVEVERREEEGQRQRSSAKQEGQEGEDRVTAQAFEHRRNLLQGQWVASIARSPAWGKEQVKNRWKSLLVGLRHAK